MIAVRAWLDQSGSSRWRAKTSDFFWLPGTKWSSARS